ncbi:MAG: hypothetical protein ATN35_09110 [Epulopiscium sp. Nele67-Bin004]|nr:MAG: hypothetical protein ATN35_09110 [Epulopiscium sp. Nele67-Bin004]
MNLQDKFWKSIPDKGIKAMLQCSMKIDEKMTLIIGFDRYTPINKWNEKTINTLIFLAKSIAIYVG